MERLVLLVSSLREESKAAHYLLKKYRLLLGSTRLVMERRIPEQVTKTKVRNTCDKATIAGMVAEQNRLEQMYSPHKVPADGDERVRGSLCLEVDLIGPRQERGYTTGSLRSIAGFRTNLGPISFPKGPLKGYILDRTILGSCLPLLRVRGGEEQGDLGERDDGEGEGKRK